MLLVLMAILVPYIGPPASPVAPSLYDWKSDLFTTLAILLGGVNFAKSRLRMPIAVPRACHDDSLGGRIRAIRNAELRAVGHVGAPLFSREAAGVILHQYSTTVGDLFRAGFVAMAAIGIKAGCRTWGGASCST